MSDKRKFLYTFEADVVNEWRYCPVCGAEIIEVYLGDHFGNISCMGEHGEDEGTDFKITWEEITNGRMYP